MTIMISKDEAFGQNVLVQFDDAQTAQEFASFTNDFTVWNAYLDDDEVVITVEELGEEGDDLETIYEYAQRYVKLIDAQQASKVQKLLDETRLLLEMEQDDSWPPEAIEDQIRKTQEAYTAYMQQPDERK